MGPHHFLLGLSGDFSNRYGIKAELSKCLSKKSPCFPPLRYAAATAQGCDACSSAKGKKKKTSVAIRHQPRRKMEGPPTVQLCRRFSCFIGSEINGLH